MVVVHIAGDSVQVGNQKRQRCAWCGAVLLDYDLTNVASAIEYDAEGNEIPWEGPSFWGVGSLVAVNGNESYVIDHTDGEVLPDGACGKLPHDVTGARSV